MNQDGDELVPFKSSFFIKTETRRVNREKIVYAKIRAIRFPEIHLGDYSSGEYNVITLGEYRGKERAKEILREIFDIYSTGATLTYEMPERNYRD